MIDAWKNLDQNVPSTLRKLKNIGGVASVFNANIAAVLHVSPEKFQQWHKTCGEPDLTSVKLKLLNKTHKRS